MADKVDILVLGSGGREHALLAKLAESPRAGKIWAAPGNGGTHGVAKSVMLDIEDGDAVAEFAEKNGVGLVVVGPEAPLVAGVADVVRRKGIPVFGPDAQAARIEGSKAFAKEVMEAADVPTAVWRAFTDEAEALAYVADVASDTEGVVVKADGLAGGKGVFVAQNRDEAESAVKECFGGAFGDAGKMVIIEELLTGPECSLLSLTDGKTVVALATSQDHKRALDGDKGPNTGGMGVYSPVPIVTKDELEAMTSINERVVAELAREGTPYVGCLYGGFMLTEDGPKVLEFNCRFGDPETQVVLPRMDCDLVDVFLACANGTLSDAMIDWDDDWAVSVVLTSAGYPASYETGKVISGVDAAASMDGVTVYHAGTRVNEEGVLLTAGGRVLDVTAQGPTFEAARDRAYEAAGLIDFEGKTLRTDIGAKALLGRRAWGK